MKRSLSLRLKFFSLFGLCGKAVRDVCSGSAFFVFRQLGKIFTIYNWAALLFFRHGLHGFHCCLS